ncbi:MAG: UDP-glucose 4-epimerase GalE [Acetobacteraceae bacterium]|nr:UDP-glucose 4-epimerase GalE [Acetobacteraceae bacterium]
MPHYLVTGGAGYVGSHTVLALREAGAEVTVLDDLSTGHAEAVPAGVALVRGDAGDERLLRRLFAERRFDAVFHFAALSLVGESARRPLHYLARNLSTTARLAEAAAEAGCLRFVLSSTAAIFAEGVPLPIGEDAPQAPASAYGDSKRMAEAALAWAERAYGLRCACLRYFNAAGADPALRTGEDHRPETHLIPLAIRAALGQGPALTVHGNDYPTPDGTAIRDYVHVSDLAAAHLAVLPLLERGSVRFNLGTGRGHSVREVIAAVERVLGRPVPHRIGPRRAGDVPALVASPARIKAATGWRPRLSALEDIVATALAWHRARPEGFRSRSAAAAPA